METEDFDLDEDRGWYEQRILVVLLALLVVLTVMLLQQDVLSWWTGVRTALETALATK